MKKSEISKSEIDSVITLFSKGELGKALNIANKLVGTFSDNSLLHNVIGACYAGLGQLGSAVKSYEKAIEIDPEYAKAHYNLGVAFQELNKSNESIVSYEKSIEIDPNHAEAYNNLGSVYLEISNYEKAIKSYKNALLIKPDYIEANYSLAIALQDQGDTEEMINQLKKVLEIQPDLDEAHYRIGLGFQNLGEQEKAIKYYQRSIEINPNFSEAYNNLGNVFKELEQPNEAIDAYKNAIKINPDFPVLHNNLGNVLKDLGQFDEAIKSYNEAIKYNPDYPDSLNNIGVIYFELGELKDSIVCFKKAIKSNPKYIDAYLNLSKVFKETDDYDEALNYLSEAIKIDQYYVDAHVNLGNLYKDFAHFQKDPEHLQTSISCYKKAIEIDPFSADAYNNLGNALKDLKRHEESLESFEKAIELNPELTVAYNNYGSLLSEDLNRHNDAIVKFKKAIDIDNKLIPAHLNLGHSFCKIQQYEDAIYSYIKVLNIDPSVDYILGNLLSAKMQCSSWDQFQNLIDDVKSQIDENKKVIDPFSLFGLIDNPALHRKATQIRVTNNFPRNTSLPVIIPYSLHSKIRIGYFSADFREHPLAYLTAELYEVHDRDHFEVHAFSFGPDTNDEMNLRIKAGVDHFHNIEVMSHKDIALLARSLEIDIAVDLGGLTEEARTDIFAMSAAPIQLSYIGFLGTMGADYYDYLIADPVMIPKESQKHYAEKIVYLPSFQVNDSKDLPPDITLTRKDVGLPETGFVFCCFNNTWKITPIVFDSWARILNAVEDSVLVVFASNETSKVNLTKEIALRHINPNRLIFADRYERPEYLARYRVADLFLDTHPYNAGTTASDALKMGLPLLTMQGKSFNSREAASILTSINLPELITNTPKEYEALAIELATHPEKLKVIKDKLADNLSTAPLFDTKRFTKNIESAYTQMYERSQQGLEPDHIYVEE